MSTEGAYNVYRAVIHAVRPDGKVEVRVPALIGNVVIVLNPPSGGYDTPAPGDVRMIAVSNDKTIFQWLVSADTPDLSAMESDLSAMESRLDGHDSDLAGHETRLDDLEVDPPRGLIASTQNTGQVSCAINTVTYLTTAINITLSSARKYRLAWSFRASGRQDGSDINATVYTNIILYDNTTPLNGNTWVDHWYKFKGQWDTLNGMVYVTGDNTARSLRLGIGSGSSPSSALYIYPTWFGIEDVGPA